MKKLSIVVIRLFSLFFVFSFIYSAFSFFTMSDFTKGYKPQTSILFYRVTSLLLAIILWVLANKFSDKITKNKGKQNHVGICRLVFWLVGLYFFVDSVSGLVSYFGYPPIYEESLISLYWFIEKIVKINFSLLLILGSDILVKAVFTCREKVINSKKITLFSGEDISLQSITVAVIRIMLLLNITYYFQNGIFPIIADVLRYGGTGVAGGGIVTLLLMGMNLIFMLLIWVCADKLASFILRFTDKNEKLEKIEISYLHIFKIAITAAGVLILIAGCLNIFEVLTISGHSDPFYREEFYSGVLKIAAAVFLILKSHIFINITGIEFS